MREKRDTRELAVRNQRMVSMRKEGHSLQDIATEFKISMVRVHTILQREKHRKEKFGEVAHIYLTALT